MISYHSLYEYAFGDLPPFLGSRPEISDTESILDRTYHLKWGEFFEKPLGTDDDGDVFAAIRELYNVLVVTLISRIRMWLP